jgi:hypothetical protein
MARKSLYLFLTALLGTLLFLTLHQAAYFIYIYLLGTGLAVSDMSYVEFLAVEYFTLTITMMLGAWYGIWLGLYWYEKVYEEKSHRGFVHHLAVNYFPGSGRKAQEGRMAEVKERLEENLWQLEKLAQKGAGFTPAVEPKPIKRRVVRKKAPRKLNGI